MGLFLTPSGFAVLGQWRAGRGGLAAGLWVGRPVGVLLPRGVIVVAAPLPNLHYSGIND